MREEVYNYLREYGFTKEEVYSFEKENEKMFFTNLTEVNKNIDFLINKGFYKELEKSFIEVFKNHIRAGIFLCNEDQYEKFKI